MTNESDNIVAALDILQENNPNASDGRWLEELTVSAAPHLREWDVSDAWLWADWPHRKDLIGVSAQDLGIDAVMRRRSDGRFIAVQCKARKLDDEGKGDPIHKGEIDKFASLTSRDKDYWAERWIVTNGANEIGANADVIVKDKALPIKLVNIHHDIKAQSGGAAVDEEICDGSRVSRQAMQDEAVETSVRLLREHERSDSGGLPIGQARGRLILPCGTGKTRISLRIVEELSDNGDIAVVLCPSIALVAQLRKEYLIHAQSPIRALAVCSDETAGYDPKKEGSRDTGKDPWVDNSNVSASEIKGQVTTDAAEIGAWITDAQSAGQLNVIFGTYQSGSRVAQALRETSTTAKIIVADEAHRTSGLRRKKSRAAQLANTEKRILDFTLCHDNDKFPAIYRVYQTATPRLWDTSQVQGGKPSDYIVRSMDDETVFGVELYRKSYKEAVENGWLSDYRIIALGVNDRDAYEAANALAKMTKSKGRRALTAHDFIRGLGFTLAMGGALRGSDEGDVKIESAIAFMNTVDKSKNMAADLESDVVREWLDRWMSENRAGASGAKFNLEHLDASSNVTKREQAKDRLAEACEAEPHGVINVGIFGEGTDSPSLSAVAFLEPRKSPIDVVQAVGRAMRVAEGKKMGYIICPIVFPVDKDPEVWLSTAPESEWKELGQILLALRAHDDRIENELQDLLQMYVPPSPEYERNVVTLAMDETKRVRHWEHVGKVGSVFGSIRRALSGQSPMHAEFRPLTDEPLVLSNGADAIDNSDPAQPVMGGALDEARREPKTLEHGQIYTGKRNSDGSIEVRRDAIVRKKPAAGKAVGEIDLEKSKKRGREMINKNVGQKVTQDAESKRAKRAERAARGSAQLAMEQLNWDEYGNAITVNLLRKSGLTGNRVQRDLNILEGCVMHAAHELRASGLKEALDAHFQLDNLQADKRAKQADGCVTASLIMMNAAMLHQRIANGAWLRGVSDLSEIKNAVNIRRDLVRQWNLITRWDFNAVLVPAIAVIEAIEDTMLLDGLDKALRHITAEAERIAETYADMGSDHAGPLFNKVMGNQASDGAFFTRPTAASLAARLTLDACGDVDWRDPAVWREHKTIDIACGSGTLLAAMLTDMKRRAKEKGASDAELAALQKLAVEEVIKGLDINPVSLQLAAAQLTAGNHDIRYKRMGLHQMPYGPSKDDPSRVFAGTLELLGQSKIVPQPGQFDLGDDAIGSQGVWSEGDDAELEDAVDAAKDARIVIMNPPYTSRVRMGEKFSPIIRGKLRRRMDGLVNKLDLADADASMVDSSNAVGPLFVALAEKAIRPDDGTLTIVSPTISLSAPSGLGQRIHLARRFRIHTILTCHELGNIAMSQNTAINESVIIATRAGDRENETRIINLDRFPMNEEEMNDFHLSLNACERGEIPNGWGNISFCSAEKMRNGDWSAAIWRDEELSFAASRFAYDRSMSMMGECGFIPNHTGRDLVRAHALHRRVDQNYPGAIPVIDSKGADGQRFIQSIPDAFWAMDHEGPSSVDGKQSYLLITEGHASATGRLTAVADHNAYVGNSWMPVPNMLLSNAKALAVFLNSTAGRLQLMRNAGRKLEFPLYRPAGVANIRIPDIEDERIVAILSACYERTKDMLVPQFRDGECEVRRLWDEAVAEAMGWDPKELERYRLLLHQEPHVRGLGYGQYAEELPEDAEYDAIAVD